MPEIEPLPFRLRVPRKNSWTADGPRKVHYNASGILHLEAGILILEWTISERVQQVGILGARDETRDYASEAIEFPVGWIAEVELRGGWWLPRLRLRARWLQAFEGVPGASPAAITLWIPYRYRRLAPPMAAAIEAGRKDPTTPLPPDPGTPSQGLLPE